MLNANHPSLSVDSARRVFQQHRSFSHAICGALDPPLTHSAKAVSHSALLRVQLFYAELEQSSRPEPLLMSKGDHRIQARGSSCRQPTGC